MIKKARASLTVKASFLMAVIAIVFLGLKNEVFWFLGLGLITILGAYIVAKFNLLGKTYQLLVFSLPLSLELEIFNGAKLIFPSEYLALFIAIALLFKLDRNRSILLQSLSGLKWLFPLVSVLVVGTIFSTQMVVSSKYTIVYILYIWVFAAGMFVNGIDRFVSLKRLFTVYSISYCLVVFWSIYHWSTYQFNPVTVPGIFEPFYADHTIFGASSIVLLVFWLTELFRSGLNKQNLESVVFTSIAFIGVSIASSRAAFLSLPVGLLVFMALKVGFRKRHLALTISLAAIALFFYRQEVVDTIEYNDYNSRDEHANLLEKTASVANVQTDVSNLERINRWAAAVNMFKERPIIGFGPGVFQFAYIPYQDERFKNRLSVEDVHHIPQNSGGTVHSELFLHLSELGILGLTAFLILIFGLIWLVLSTKAENRSHTLIVCFAIMSTYFFHGLFNNFLNTDKFAFLFWGAAGTFLSELKK